MGAAATSATDNSPSSAEICDAVALGWQLAQLFHEPVHNGAISKPAVGDHLPGRSEFSEATRSKWLAEQVNFLAHQLLGSYQNLAPDNWKNDLEAMVRKLNESPRNRKIVIDAIFTAHCAVLEALGVADFRLQKAYQLGRALAETAMIPAKSADPALPEVFATVLGTGRLTTIRTWLVDLKSLLPGHTAYAIAGGLADWQMWLAQADDETAWKDAQTKMRAQGRLWREILTGEKSATDLLDVGSYTLAARRVARRVGRWLLQYWQAWSVPAAITIAVVVVVSTLHQVPTSVRIVANLVWLAGVLGLSLKGTGKIVGSALGNLEGWLWQSELDEAIALAAACLPEGTEHRRPDNMKVGSLAA